MKINRGKTTLSKARWAKYAIAGVAGAATATSSGTSVDADFTFVEVNQRIEDRIPQNAYADLFGPYSFGSTGPAFSFYHVILHAAGTAWLKLWAIDSSLSFAGHQTGEYRYVSNVANGGFISNLGTFLQGGRSFGSMALGFGYSQSQFLNPGLSFIGFRFDLGNGTQYGFAELNMEDGAPLNTATFVRYGWGDPGDEVFAGQRPFVPEPSCLGMLALGTLGLTVWRKKRAADKRSRLMAKEDPLGQARMEQGK